MRRTVARLFLVLFLCVAVAGCAVRELTYIDPTVLNPPVDSGDYVQKVDNFYVILDASNSMEEAYPTDGKSKFSTALETVNRMNLTVPDGLELTATLRKFGGSCIVLGPLTDLLYGPAKYSKLDYLMTLRKPMKPSSISPLHLAMDAAAEDLATAKGGAALVIVSDGKEMTDAPVASATRIKSRYGDSVCIYTVHVGDDVNGRELLSKVATAGGCGFATGAGDIYEPQAMADYVRRVLLKKAPPKPTPPPAPEPEPIVVPEPPKDSDGDGVIDDLDLCPGTPMGVTVDKNGCPLDTDGDGVYDYLDQCPGTPKGAPVNAVGCWIVEGLNFDVDKADIKSRYEGALAVVIKVLRMNPGMKVEIQGHTDSDGSDKYNQELSARRAKAVENYLVNKGVSAKMLSSAGYGESKPVASNDTPEGKAQNRRVELRIK